MTKYQIWSQLPPALVRRNAQNPLEGSQVRAGTIQRLQSGGTVLPIDYVFPAGTTLSDFTWEYPSTRPEEAAGGFRRETVAGSHGETYLVTIWQSGKKTCTCKGFIYRRNCKHIEGRS